MQGGRLCGLPKTLSDVGVGQPADLTAPSSATASVAPAGWSLPESITCRRRRCRMELVGVSGDGLAQALLLPCRTAVRLTCGSRAETVELAPSPVSAV
jgi:hypothetical protein